MSIGIHPEELSFFSVLAASPSLSVAARELGISTPAVSRRLAQMEARLGVLLVNRTTRRMSLTPEGDALLERARRILLEIDELNQMLSASVATPKGLLRVNATLGFGRNQIAPVISRFVERYPEVEPMLNALAALPGQARPSMAGVDNLLGGIEVIETRVEEILSTRPRFQQPRQPCPDTQ